MSEVQNGRPLDYPVVAPTPLEPPEEWAELRRSCPVAGVTFPSGDAAVLLTRYADVRTALADPRLTREGLARADAARITAGDAEGIFSSPMAKALNDEGHERWRRMVGKWFTAKRMAALKPRMEEMADQLVDVMIEHGGPVDVVSHLAFPLPVYVICTMLGVPESDREHFKAWSDTFLNMTKYTREETDAAHRDFADYMSGLIAGKRDAPGDDLLSQLLNAADADGEPMSEAGLVATGQALLLAGHETTAGFIAMMTAHLLSDRARWERLVEGRSLIRSAVEEVLRFDPNGSGFGMLRYAHEDIELSGGTVPRGTTVVCSMAAANRDENAWENPGVMDVGRSPNPHLTFGVGPHSCLGQPLARTELQAVLAVLLRRLPQLRLAVDADALQRHEGMLTSPLREVPVTW
ncbi:cytochrome P450 [Streptomyces sp. NPDC051453]|uniref:cytochrome P450 n=1 Tax=Streptomyces sp. NPDC051453 TaxID=3154941 RepID=UPI003418183B